LRLLEPLAFAIGRHVRSTEAVFADDTPISMLAPGTGTTQTSRLWTCDVSTNNLRKVADGGNVVANLFLLKARHGYRSAPVKRHPPLQANATSGVARSGGTVAATGCALTATVQSAHPVVAGSCWRHIPEDDRAAC